MLEDDTEWERVLKEASIISPGPQFRQLFTTVLIHCQAAKPRKLFDDFYEFLAADILYGMRQQFKDREVLSSDPDVLQRVLLDLERYMMNNEKSIKDYNLPKLVIDENNSITNNKHINRELDYNRKQQLEIYQDLYSKANTEQKEFVDICINLVKKQYLEEDEDQENDRNNVSNLIELIAFAGSGKTFCFKILASFCRSNGKIFLPVASTGIATTTAVEGATTAHYRFGIPLNCDENSYCKINKNSKQADLIRQAVMITWDEIVMTHRNILECVDRTLRDICDEPDKPFGGKIFIVAGDYRQLLPVVKGAGRGKIVDSLIKNSPSMQTKQKVSLKHNMRIKNRNEENSEEANAWQEFLAKIGNGTHEIVNENDKSIVEIPKEMISEAKNMKEFVQSCYGDMKQYVKDTKLAGKRMIITNKNEDVDRLNNIAMNLLPGKEIVLTSIDSCDVDNDLFGPEVLKYHNPSSLPPHFLKLKINCIVTLIRNLDPAEGLCNGTRIIITHITYRLLKGLIIGCDKFEGKEVLIPRITTIDANSNNVFTLHRKQFPVKLAYCMTVHKIQGQTLDKIFYYLKSNPFTHGQAFVALSRVGQMKDIKIFANFSNATQKGKTFIKNIVWKEVLDVD